MKKTSVITSVSEFRNLNLLKTNKSIGLVPTMGALHAGHASLMQMASQENEISVVSVFVNPTQFNNSVDLEKYPKTFEADLALLEKNNIDILFLPNYKEVYPDNYRFKLSENEFSKILCGAHRPGHFDGVLTVVLKLLQITNADQAYFGLKDYQQYKLINDMAEALFLKTKITGCPTVREKSGLAMSSRNLRLSPEGLAKASLIYKTITEIKDLNLAQEKLTQAGFEIDYLEDIENRRYVAASIEGVRLIDNVELKK